MATDRQPLSDWTLERFATGDLPPSELEALRKRIAAEPELAARLESLQRSDGEILAQHPAGDVMAEVRRRAGRPAPAASSWKRSFWIAAPAFAATMVLFVMFAGPKPPPVDEDRVKGAPRLLAYQVRGTTADPLADGAVVAPGDVVQLRYSSGGHRYGAIVSVDGKGAVTLHWPEDPGAPSRLDPKGEVSLPHAFQLDDAPGFERFFFVVSGKPVPVARVLEAAKALARQRDADTRPLDLPPDWKQETLHLRKVSP